MLSSCLTADDLPSERPERIPVPEHSPVPQSERDKQSGNSSDNKIEFVNSFLCITCSITTQTNTNEDPTADKSQKDDETSIARSAKDAAWHQISVGWWQVYVGLAQSIVATLGIAGLVWTIVLGRRATNAAIVASKAAQDSVNVAQSTAARELRAYLSIMIRSFSVVDNSKLINVEFEIKNVGTTPAVNVSVGSNITIAPFPITDTYVFPAYVFDGNCVVHNGVPIVRTQVQTQGFTNVDSGRIARRQDRIYCYGRVKYTDMFGTARYTNFCVCVVSTAMNVWFINPVGARPSDTLMWHYADTHNDIS